MENLKTFESFGKNDKLLKMIDANQFDGWCGEQLKVTYTGVILEDSEYTDGLKYNGWYEEFQSQAIRNNELAKILGKAKENIVSFWNNGLTDTYPVILKSDCPDCEVKYNGWYEELVQWSI